MIDTIAIKEGIAEKQLNQYRSNNPDFQIRLKPNCITNNNGKRFNLLPERAVCTNARKTRRIKRTRQIDLKSLAVHKRLEENKNNKFYE